MIFYYLRTSPFIILTVKKLKLPKELKGNAVFVTQK